MFYVFRVNGAIRAELWVGGLPWFVVVQETSGAEFIGLMGVWAGGDLRMDESVLKDDNGEM